MPDINMQVFEEAKRNQLVTEVDIQTQVALNDYQVQLSDITNPTQSQDNVVIDRHGEFLPHWNESLDFDTWIKISMELAGKKLLIIHGNDSLSNSSNGKSVFNFFDYGNQRTLFDDDKADNVIGHLYGEPSALHDGTYINIWSTRPSDAGIAYSYSTDGKSFTTVNTNIPAGTKRGHILKIGSTYYFYGALGTDTSIKQYTSTDKTTFTDQGTVLSLGPGTYDDQHIANSFIWKESANDWRMLYESIGTGTGGKWVISYATSTDGLNWTKSGSNPVLTGGGNGIGNPELLRQGNATDGSITKFDGKYYMYYHGDGTVYRAYSTDLITWTKEGVVEGIRYTAAWSDGDQCLVEFDGKTFLYFSNSNQVDSSYINVSIDNRIESEFIALPPHTTWDSYTGGLTYSNWKSTTGGIEYIAADDNIKTTSPGSPNSLNIFSPFTRSNNLIYNAQFKANTADRPYFLLKATKNGLQSTGAFGVRCNCINNAVDIYDGATSKASTAFTYTNGVWYNLEWIVKDDYAIDVRLWVVSGSRPSAATLSYGAHSYAATGGYTRLGSLPSAYSLVNYFNNFRMREYILNEPTCLIGTPKNILIALKSLGRAG